MREWGRCHCLGLTAGIHLPFLFSPFHSFFRKMFRQIVSPTWFDCAWLAKEVHKAGIIFVLFAHPCQCFSAKKGLSLHKNTSGNKQRRVWMTSGLLQHGDQVDLMGDVGRMSGCPLSCFMSRIPVGPAGRPAWEWEEGFGSFRCRDLLLGACAWCGCACELRTFMPCTVESERSSAHQHHF